MSLIYQPRIFLMTIKNPKLRGLSIVWQIAAFTIEWSMIMFAMCLMGLHGGHLASLGITLLWVCTFKMPKGWNTAEDLIYNAKDRAHDCVVPYSITILAWIIFKLVGVFL